jgi:hypothetical protein
MMGNVVAVNQATSNMFYTAFRHSTHPVAIIQLRAMSFSHEVLRHHINEKNEERVWQVFYAPN